MWQLLNCCKSHSGELRKTEIERLFRLESKQIGLRVTVKCLRATEKSLCERHDFQWAPRTKYVESGRHCNYHSKALLTCDFLYRFSLQNCMNIITCTQYSWDFAIQFLKETKNPKLLHIFYDGQKSLWHHHIYCLPFYFGLFQTKKQKNWISMIELNDKRTWDFWTSFC